MVHEAEENADADKKRKEEADLVNEANNLIFQTKKSLGELKNVTDDEKNEANKLCDELQAALDKNDLAEIKVKKEALEKKAQDIAVRAYQQAQEEHGGNNNNNNNGSTNNDGTVDADFSDVQ